MLVVFCPEHMEAVRVFARSVGAEEKLEARLRYLGSYGGDGDIVRASIYQDWAPWSFTFVMEKRQDDGWARWFAGGLVYSGPGQPLDGSAPAFTVSLDPDCGREHDWSVHT